MKGSDFYTAVQSLVSGFSIDSVLFYQMLNTARIRWELMRPWMVLRTYQYSQTLSPGPAPMVMPPSASITIPTDFQFFTRDGEITLYNNNNQFETYTEIPLDLAIPYLQNANVFFSDYNAGKFYFCGVIDQSYKAFIQYQANLGDITATSTWINFPTWCHMLLAYEVAAMYRLGLDYDDINARNADRNIIDAKQLYAAMVSWDDNRQRSATTRTNMPPITQIAGANFNKQIDTSRGY